MDAIAVHGPRQDRRNPVPGWDDTVEEWSYYSADEVVRAYAAISGDQLVGEDGVWIAEQSRVNLSCPPVAFEQLPSPDGAFRGILDQVGESLMTKNKAVDYLMTYMHQMIYTPFIAQNILNASDPPGPDTIYQVDPTAQNAQMQRVSPATPANQAFGLIQYIDQEQRGQLGYPSARQGEVSQSIASAAFVASTQGQLTSMVRDIQRLIGDLRERASYIAFELDERFLDFEKPLLRPVGKKRTYTPSRDINKQYDVQVTYGAGAGLDRLNTDARLLQLYGSGAISQETVLSNTDFVSEATTEMEKREREEIGRVILQRFAGDPSVSLDFIIEVYRLQRDEGLSLVDAMTKAQEQQAAQPQPQQPGEMAPQPQAQPSAQEQQTAIQKGGTPQAPQGAPAIPGAFSPPPLEQILVRPR